MNEVTFEEDEIHPKPNEFEIFLPWACHQLQVDAAIKIVKVARAEYISVAQIERAKVKGKSRAHQRTLVDVESVATDEASGSDNMHFIGEYKTIVQIFVYYDNTNNLIEIKFDKNEWLPRDVLQIIGLIVPFHTNLSAITINKGLDKFVIYELQKFLSVSNITDICLDNNAHFAEACYDILLESQSKLRQLSLARCGINDKVCQNIASKLMYTNPGSRTLSVLNLSSNRITDLGAKYLGNALRSNRKLNYLNLADNLIGNEGAMCILNALQEFALSSEELYEARFRHLIYLKKRKDLVARLARELMMEDFDKKVIRRKSVKPSSVPLKKVKSIEMKNYSEIKSIMTIQSICVQKAQAMAINVLGEFDDPFNTQNIDVRNGKIYCNGNNTLCYLNLAYNNLSYFSAKLLLDVLIEQKCMDKKPRGLINVVIEGNVVPKCCTELIMIDQLINHGLSKFEPKTAGKKKPTTKTSKFI